ncbi:MAG TPA: beta-ketoacyl synthase N-terminal-like domain-containing protein [Anaerolineales bacterium]|nr:beta-ketoacyl synthase N-terminal-like domain-containing protein [Anaerolineales bacterium]HLF01107.1 beta-ketoacyl synthase N-terminal-like domain-containing protein [Anaerolineales bacterium]
MPTIRPVSIVGAGQIEVMKASPSSLRAMGAAAVGLAMGDAGVDHVDALFAGNMLSDELQGQKHVAALIADHAGLRGIEALEVKAATATGAAALRMAYFAVASGEADLAIAVGVEKMSDGVATPALAKALDAEKEVPSGATLISRNADLMRLYFERHKAPEDAFVNFAVNAHKNALTNPNALFREKRVTAREVLNSRAINPPIRLLDCAPICDGAAAVVLAPTAEARAYTAHPVHILASSVATDRFRVHDRRDPLWLEAAYNSAQAAFRRANINRNDIDLFEAHDAFTIMTCLLLEAVGYAKRGQGWRLAAENEIKLKGRVPVSTFGGLKARGHPIGATALYQVCEIVLQLTERAGKNQVPNARLAMLQSVGGAATTVLTHLFGV